MEKKETLIDYWAKSSKLDFEAAFALFEKEKYPHALFFGHLAIEKILKAIYVKHKDTHPPYTHNLMMLAKPLDLGLSEIQLEHLIEINTFNIETRYPDEKFKFYQRCTHQFTDKYIHTIEEFLSWLRTKL